MYAYTYMYLHEREENDAVDSIPRLWARRSGGGRPHDRWEFLGDDRRQGYPGPADRWTLSFEILEVGEGFALFAGEPGPHLLNPMGAVHGGWALTLIDTVTGCAAHTLMPARTAYTTIETKANFTRPITKDTGRVRGEGRVVGRGRRIIITEGQILDAEGRILAHGASTLMVLNGNGPAPSA